MLRVVLRKTTLRKTYKVKVFSDSEIAIRKIQGLKTRVNQVLKAQIVKKVKQYQSKSNEVIIQLVFSHSKIKRNK